MAASGWKNGKQVSKRQPRDEEEKGAKRREQNRKRGRTVETTAMAHTEKIR